MTGVLSRNVLVIVFALLVVVLAIVSPTFRDVDNLLNVLEQNAIIGIVACGMLLMILLGGFDLSVGAVGALSSCSLPGRWRSWASRSGCWSRLRPGSPSVW
ncbi:hypothetical protein [Pseudonocardia sp. TRM90224]|uniref:hypothetical protein n=1 Tax=Pseudonocardia sp. TRM90224 TaxID=2812678 RepID=UPI001E305B4B|nr:hypothetical protein [Pseudonocardia sp. TRM90224]